MTDNLNIESLQERDYTTEVLSLIADERQRQLEKWGDQSGHSDGKWLAILGEEYGEVCRDLFEGKDPGKEIIQVAAVATAWAEARMYREDLADLENKEEDTESETLAQRIARLRAKED